MRAISDNGCNCITGAPVTNLVDLTGTVPDLPTAGAIPHTTICARDAECGVSIAQNSTFVTPGPDAATRLLLLGPEYTASIKAKVTTSGRLQFLLSYAIEESDAASNVNVLMSLRITNTGFFGSLWERGVGVNHTITSTIRPMLNVWYLFTTRVAITGATAVCELLIDGELVATSGSLGAPAGGELCKLQIGDGQIEDDWHLDGGFAFADLSVGLRSNDYLRNLRGFGRNWGIDANTFARIVPDV